MPRNSSAFGATLQSVGLGLWQPKARRPLAASKQPVLTGQLRRGKSMNDAAKVGEAREVQSGHFDPYQLHPAHVLEPPISFGEIMRKTSPGMVLAASSVGSGEPILTITLGAKVRYNSASVAISVVRTDRATRFRPIPA